MFRSVMLCCIILFCRIIFLTGGGGSLIPLMDAPPERGLFDVFWHKRAPLKVSVFTWRLFRNRLPTKDNLARQRVIHQDDILCVGGCGSFETVAHLLFGCLTFSSVWPLVYQ